MTCMVVVVGRLCPLQSAGHFGLAQAEVESSHPSAVF